MCFTDFVGEPATRSLCGWANITVVSFFALVHILFLVADVCKQPRLYMRKWYIAYKNKKIMREKARKDNLKKVNPELADEESKKKKSEQLHTISEESLPD